MSFDHIKRVTALIGGKTYTYRSKLEYRYAVYLEMLKDSMDIDDWLYEDEEVPVAYDDGSIKMYRPDFTVLVDGEWEFHETKGWFKGKDVTLMKKYTQQYDTPLTLIFARKPTKMQLRRALKLEPHLKRIIWDADKSLFDNISFMFEH